MSRGRKLKLVDSIQGNRTYEEKEERKEIEENVKKSIKGVQRTPPKHTREGFLDGEASREWNRIYPLLAETPVSALDKNLVESYCVTYAMFKLMQKKVNEEGVTVRNRHGEVVANPLIREMKSLSAEIRSLSVALGMTVDSRMKMALQNKELESDKKEGNILDLFEDRSEG